VEYIINSNIKIFGCDLPSVDVSGSKDKPIHNALLGSNIIVYESLANLNQLPLLTPFEFYGFPLPFVGLDGSPVRAVAILD
jgi:kynurenine formamidase